MNDEFTVDALKLKRDVQRQVHREIAGLTPEEQVRWFQGEGARAHDRVVPQEEQARKQ